MSSDSQHTIIQASAGSGKTFQLSNRFLHLVLDGAAPENILASTFTKKAAGEILDRIISRLAEAALNDKKRSELAKHLELKNLTTAKCLAMVGRLTRNLYRLRVSTLDAFFAQIAGAFSLELQLPPGWRIVDELEDARLRTRAIGNLLRNNETDDIKRLTYALSQGEATRGVADLIRGAVGSLYKVFCVTPAEAWQRLPRSKPLSDIELSECYQLLQAAELPNMKSYAKARLADLERIAVGDWEKFYHTGIAGAIHKGKTTLGNCKKEFSSTVIGLYEKLNQHAKAVLTERLRLQTEGTYELLERFHAEYTRLKQDRQALRFEDIERRVAGSAIISDASRLAFRMDAQVNHLLLDEFQDTSPEQWKILRSVAEPIVQPESEGSFFCVGDQKQAIFGWRGGVAEIFDDVHEFLPDVEPTPLDESYRSSPIIMQTVNTVFENLQNHPDPGRTQAAMHSWREKFRHHETAKTELPGYATLESTREHDIEIGENAAFVCAKEAVQRVEALRKEAPACSVGVLVRTNATVVLIGNLLQAARIPFAAEGGSPLTDSAGVSVVLSALRLADHPGDKPSRFHVLHSPLNDLFTIQNEKDQAGSFAAATAIRSQFIENGYGATVETWVEKLMPLGDKREQERLQQLVSLAYSYQPQATLRVSDFRRVIENQKILDAGETGVHVMTYHKSKGLEFDAVVLPELYSNLIGQAPSFVVDRETPTAPIKGVVRHANQKLQELLPTDMQTWFAKHEARVANESLCMLYVALTRARSAVHMIIPPNTKSSHKTMAGVLLATLAPDAEVTTSMPIWSLGEVDWAKSRKVSPKETAVEELPTETLIEISLAPAGSRRVLGRSTPSSLEGGGRLKLSHLLDSARHATMQAGTLLHHWMRYVGWSEDGVPTEESLREYAQSITTGSVDLTDALAAFSAAISGENISQLLSKTGYRSLAKLADDIEIESQPERTFAVLHKGSVLQGSIDRLVVHRRGDEVVGAEVIDFKTDQLTSTKPGAIKKRVSFYEPQLRAYEIAAASFLQLERSKISVRIVFLSHDEIVTL